MQYAVFVAPITVAGKLNTLVLYYVHNIHVCLYIFVFYVSALLRLLLCLFIFVFYVSALLR